MRNHCQRNCSSCCSCCSCAPQIQTICTCARYVDVPMSIHTGSGYTELECCQDTLEVLKEISCALQRMAPAEHCCQSGCGQNWHCC